jgi:hypothetical protein
MLVVPLHYRRARLSRAAEDAGRSHIKVSFQRKLTQRPQIDGPHLWGSAAFARDVSGA